jgi:outer membrane immunogenic protein
MKLLSGILGLTLTSVVALASANAADMYRAPMGGGMKDGPYMPVATWAGFYAGVNGGYAFSESSDQLAWTTAPSFAGLAPEGGFGGGQIGYNWQGFYHPNLVVGIEADIQGADITDTGTDGIFKYSSTLDWFGTVRGRLGYASDRTLVYATGGFAYGGLKNDVTNGTAASHYTIDSTATGYVVGGGVEYKVSPAWSLKAEYQYINLGKNDPVNPAGVHFSDIANTTLNDDAYHTVRVGLNYHMVPSYEPLK